jgi:hypothetical protein
MIMMGERCFLIINVALYLHPDLSIPVHRLIPPIRLSLSR